MLYHDHWDDLKMRMTGYWEIMKLVYKHSKGHQL